MGGHCRLPGNPTLLKGNGQVETYSFTVLSVFFLDLLLLESRLKQGLSSALARVQGVAAGHLVSPPGSNIKVTSRFKCECRSRAQVGDFWV